MNPLAGSFVSGASPMPEIVADRVRAPVVACFSIPESRNLDGLILIRFCLARDARTREPPHAEASEPVRQN
jgi:hypothetical protein